MGHEGIGTITDTRSAEVSAVRPEALENYLDAERRQLFEVAISADALQRGELSADEESRFSSRLTTMYLHQ